MSLFDIPNLEKELEELENKTAEPDFWNDSKNSSKVLEKIKTIKSITSKHKQLE